MCEEDKGRKVKDKRMEEDTRKELGRLFFYADAGDLIVKRKRQKNSSTN
jgi:hypothetical protein